MIQHKSRYDKTKYTFNINVYNSKFWYKNDEYHRDKDKPAIIYGTGTMAWYKNGERHRENDKPAIIWDNGYMEWWSNGGFIRKTY